MIQVGHNVVLDKWLRHPDAQILNIVRERHYINAVQLDGVIIRLPRAFYDEYVAAVEATSTNSIEAEVASSS